MNSCESRQQLSICVLQPKSFEDFSQTHQTRQILSRIIKLWSRPNISLAILRQSQENRSHSMIYFLSAILFSYRSTICDSARVRRNECHYVRAIRIASGGKGREIAVAGQYG